MFVKFYILLFFIKICTGDSNFTVNGLIYNFINESVTYSKAVNACSSYNQSLAFVNNPHIYDELRSLKDVFIGLKYIPNKNFIWENGNISIPNLKWNETILLYSTVQCGYLQGNGTVNFGSCETKRSVLCSDKYEETTPQRSNELLNCKEGYFRFLDKCYQMKTLCNDDTYQWEEAKAICAKDEASLMVVDNFVEQEFLSAIMTKSPAPIWTGFRHHKLHPNITIWINNSTKNLSLIKYPINFKKNEPNGNGKETCAMVYHRLGNIGEFNDENCSKSLNYLCEAPAKKEYPKQSKPKPIPIFYQGNCSEGFYEFNQICYKFMLKKNERCNQFFYNPSNHIPFKLNPLLTGRLDAVYLRSLMNFMNVNLTRVNINAMQKETVWYSRDTNDKTNNTCYEFESKSKIINPCSYIRKFTDTCYYKLKSHEDVNNVMCPLDWIKVGSRCYGIFTELQTYANAKKDCKEKYGAQLATFRNMKEVHFVSKKMIKSSWIGITGESYMKDAWLDGSSLDYCLFRHTANLRKLISSKPKDHICFMMRQDKVEWDDRKCTDYAHSICEKPAILNPCAKTNFPIYIDGSCYKVFDQTIESWYEAEKTCQSYSSNKGSLASFHNKSQEERVFKYLNVSREVWIGLHIQNKELQWSDGSGLYYHRNFIVSHANVRCFTAQRVTNSQEIKWTNMNCGLKRSYICKYSLHRDSSKNKPIDPPIIDKCPSGYFYWNEFCYKLYHDKLTWSNAHIQCSKKSDGGDLASFGSFRDYYYVLSQLRLLNNSIDQVWIGYHIDLMSSQTVSKREKPNDYVRSIISIEHEDDERNVDPIISMSIDSNPYINGNWYSYSSTAKQLPYLCSTGRVKKQQESYTKLNKCTSEFKYETNAACYHIANHDMGFDEGENYCQKLNSHLLVLDDVYEEKLIDALIGTQEHGTNLYWIGIKTVNEDNLHNWVSVEGEPVWYSHWKELTLSDRYYGLFSDPKSKYRGYWSTQIGRMYELNGTAMRSSSNPWLDVQDSGMKLFTDKNIKLPVICKKRLVGTRITDHVCMGYSINGARYLLNHTKTVNNHNCVRWDIVRLSGRDGLDYLTKTRLHSSLFHDSHGYLSYSLNRCSYLDNVKNSEYGCYVYLGDKFVFEKCNHTDCMKKVNALSKPHIVFDIIFGLILLSICAFLLIFHRRILSHHTIQHCLTRICGRYKPDWLGTGISSYRYRPSPSRHYRQTPISNTDATVDETSGAGIILNTEHGGVGFVNPVYMPVNTHPSFNDLPPSTMMEEEENNNDDNNLKQQIA